MERYVDKNGGLVIDKTFELHDDVGEKENTKVKIPAQSVIESAKIYLDADPSLVYSTERHKCPICQNQTAYKTGTICFDCWDKYKDDLLAGVSTSVADVEFEIE